MGKEVNGNLRPVSKGEIRNRGAERSQINRRGGEAMAMAALSASGLNCRGGRMVVRACACLCLYVYRCTCT